MALLKSQITALLKSPKNKATINKAQRHEQRLRFHIDTNMESADASIVVNEFLMFVKSLLPKDKFNIFLQLFRFPLLTNELTEEIFEALEKVYDGKDAYEQFNFLSPEFLADYQDYRQKIEADKFWKTEAFERAKVNINGFIVVDVESDQLTADPEPYFYFLPINKVLDFDCNCKGVVEWIIFPQEENKIAVFDDETFRVFEVNDKGEITGEALIENKHDLGYCPAAFFWDETLKSGQPALKKSPLSNQLSNLDWLLFFKISKRHLDLYAPYPIYSGFEQDCNFENKSNGDYCDSGYIKNQHGEYNVSRSGEIAKCPVCSEKRLAGVGSFIEVPIPSRDNDNADLRNPVQITTIDKESLDYNVEECSRLELAIYNAVAGYGGDISMKTAYNKDQVQANTESRRNVLLSFKKNLEKIQSWTEDTICRLRYGVGYINNTIQLGTDFYLYNTEQLNKMYGDAKTAGATDYQLDLIQDQIIETENRLNPMAKSRAEILKQLEPYRHQTRTEVLAMLDKNFGDKELIAIKLNFSTFVLRFERENTDIVEFGNTLSFDKKINIILNTFKSYGKSEIGSPVTS
jgi:hypothetical protein